jgi:hypothetical protein
MTSSTSSVAGLIDDAKQDLSARTEHLQAKRKQDCEEKHLQDLALSECPHQRIEQTASRTRVRFTMSERLPSGRLIRNMPGQCS